MKKFIFAGIAVLLLATAGFALAQQGSTPVIAIAANGKLPSDSVSSQAGRGSFFLFFDSQGTFIEAVDNPYKDARNAGIPALDFLASKGVKVPVAQSFGSRIVVVMKDKGIRSVEFNGIAKDAVKKALEP